MSQAQLARFINWFAIAIALTLLLLVGLHIYKKHFLAVGSENDFLFNDLPAQIAAPLKADIQQVIQAHIMGEVPKAVVASEPVVQKPVSKPVTPKTKLDIRLTGVIDGATPESGFAMIELKRGKTAVLAVGETIGDTGAVLHQVLPGEVLVDRDGQIESVKMKRKSLELSQQMPNDSLIDLMNESTTIAATNDGDSLAATTSLKNSERLKRKQLAKQQEMQSNNAAQVNSANLDPTWSDQNNNTSVLGKLPIPKKLLTL